MISLQLANLVNIREVKSKWKEKSNIFFSSIDKGVKRKADAWDYDIRSLLNISPPLGYECDLASIYRNLFHFHASFDVFRCWDHSNAFVEVLQFFVNSHGNPSITAAVVSLHRFDRELASKNVSFWLEEFSKPLAADNAVPTPY